MKIAVNCARQIAPLPHFWESTGFTPAALLLNSDMRQTITYIGSLPHRGIKYVRIHSLLELVSVRKMDTAKPAYNWSRLDRGLDLLLANGLKPFFELMGNPSRWFDDFDDDRQLHAWKRLVRDLAIHLMKRYDKEEVENWYFETWNEPDAGSFGSRFKRSEKTFCKYYDACSQGLLEANPKLRFGGPGSCRHLSSVFKDMLAHCDRGRNYFTGKRGVRLDFISVHCKGLLGIDEDFDPDSNSISDQEIEYIQYIRANHPRLAAVPFMNDECDPQTSWYRPHFWHGKAYYAGIVAKTVNQHILRIVDGLKCNYALLSNDNNFMGSWGNRTLLTRFGTAEPIPGAPKLQALSAPKFELVKKPIFNLMAAMAMLGDVRCALKGKQDPAADVGAIASRRGDDQVAVLVYHHRDRIYSSGEETIELSLAGLPMKAATLVHYRIDEEHGDPARAYELSGPVKKLTPKQYGIMRDNAELTAMDKSHQVKIRGGKLSLKFKMPLPSVSLVLLTTRPAEKPSQVQDIRAEQFTSLTGLDNILLAWKGMDSRVIKTYEVLFRAKPKGAFKRINAADAVCSAYLHAREPEIRSGCYKVRAVDYWGRAGEFSDVLEF